MSSRGQRLHYAKVDENNGGDAGYDWERARDAEIWMQIFLNEPHAAPPTEGFTESAVEQALSCMHQGTFGLDGTSKKWIHPLRTALIPIMTALFSYVYLHGATLSAWSLAVIVSLEKKSSGGR